MLKRKKTSHGILSGKELKELIKERQHEKGVKDHVIILALNKLLLFIKENIEVAVIIIIGGIILSLRVFHPPKYYLFGEIRKPYDGEFDNVLPILIDYKTALLQSLGIAVITGVVFYAVKKINNKSLSKEKIEDFSQSGKSEIIKEKKTILRSDTPEDMSQVKEIEVYCSLKQIICDYYDMNDDCCLYGPEGIEAWKSKRCPLHDK